MNEIYFHLEGLNLGLTSAEIFTNSTVETSKEIALAFARWVEMKVMKVFRAGVTVHLKNHFADYLK